MGARDIEIIIKARDEATAVMGDVAARTREIFSIGEFGGAAAPGRGAWAARIAEQMSQRADLDRRLFDATHTARDRELRDTDEYFGRLQNRWAGHEQMLVAIQQTHAATRQQIMKEETSTRLAAMRSWEIGGIRIVAAAQVARGALDLLAAGAQLAEGDFKGLDATLRSLPLGIGGVYASARRVFWDLVQNTQEIEARRSKERAGRAQDTAIMRQAIDIGREAERSRSLLGKVGFEREIAGAQAGAERTLTRLGDLEADLLEKRQRNILYEPQALVAVRSARVRIEQSLAAELVEIERKKQEKIAEEGRRAGEREADQRRQRHEAQLEEARTRAEAEADLDRRRIQITQTGAVRDLALLRLRHEQEEEEYRQRGLDIMKLLEVQALEEQRAIEATRPAGAAARAPIEAMRREAAYMRPEAFASRFMIRPPGEQGDPMWTRTMNAAIATTAAEDKKQTGILESIDRRLASGGVALADLG